MESNWPEHIKTYTWWPHQQMLFVICFLEISVAWGRTVDCKLILIWVIASYRKDVELLPGYRDAFGRLLVDYMTNHNSNFNSTRSSTWLWMTVGTWWRHQIETFSALLAICAGNSPVPGEFYTQRPVTRSFHVFLVLRLNKRLSKQPWDRWFETLSCPLWRHRNQVQLYQVRQNLF